MTASPSVLLTRAPEPLVRRALTPSRTESWLLPGPWCLVVSGTADETERYGESVGRTFALGRYGALELARVDDALLCGVWRRGRVVGTLLSPFPDPGDLDLPDDLDDHLDDDDMDDDAEGDADGWQRLDAVDIARVAGRPDLAQPLTALLDQPSSADDLLAGLVRLLDLPAAVVPLLAGADPAGVEGVQRVAPSGFVAAVLAGMRGEFDVPGGGGWEQTTARWERERPLPYRLASATLAGVEGVLAWRAARGVGGPRRPGRAFLLALAAAGSAFSAGPPRGRWPFRR